MFSSLDPPPLAPNMTQAARFPKASSPLRPLGVALALAGVCSLAQAQARYVATELPLLTGTAQCTTVNVNELGEVVGHCGPASDAWTGQTAVVWRQGRAIPLGRWANGTYSMATVLNNLGQVGGHADTGNMRPQGWTTLGNGQWVNFFPNSSGNTYPQYLSDTGWIGGYYIKGSKGPWTGALWTPDAKDPTRYRLTDLPQLSGASDPASVQSITAGFNRLGAAVGQASNDTRGGLAVVWRADAKHSLEVLTAPAGSGSAWAQAINDLGQVIGLGSPTGTVQNWPVYHTILWSGGSPRSASVLPTLSGDRNALPITINNLGQVLGVGQTEPALNAGVSRDHPIVWRDGGVFDLQSLVDPVSLGDLRLQTATGLSHRGQIAATALRGGLKRPVLLTPVN